MTDLQNDAVDLVRQIANAAQCPDEGFVDLSPDGVDERIFAAKVEHLVERVYHERISAALT